MKPHHRHIYWDKGDDFLRPPRMITLFCDQEDCYEGLDRSLYPPELIGSKLVSIGKPE